LRGHLQVEIHRSSHQAEAHDHLIVTLVRSVLQGSQSQICDVACSWPAIASAAKRLRSNALAFTNDRVNSRVVGYPEGIETKLHGLVTGNRHTRCDPESEASSARMTVAMRVYRDQSGGITSLTRHFEPKFVYFETLDFRIERSRRHP